MPKSLMGASLAERERKRVVEKHVPGNSGRLEWLKVKDNFRGGEELIKKFSMKAFQGEG